MATIYLSGDTITLQCVYTKDGVLADPSVVPTVSLYKSGVVVGTPGTSEKISTGIYKYKQTIPEGTGTQTYVAEFKTVDDDGDPMIDRLTIQTAFATS